MASVLDLTRSPVLLGRELTPVIVSDASPANGGTYTPDASQGSLYRVATSVAGFTLGAPTNPIDGQSINIEITPSAGFSLTVAAAIALTTGITSPIVSTAGKTCFLGLRYSSGTWFLLAATTES